MVKRSIDQTHYETLTPEMRELKQEHWLRVAGVNVVLKEDQENAVNGKPKDSVREEIVAVSGRTRKNIQNRHQNPLLPLNHRKKRMVEAYREERVSEAEVHLGSLLAAPSGIELEERELVVNSGASMRMLRRKDLNSTELETVRVSKIPTTVVAANDEVLTKEEATVYVKELDLFATVMLLEDTPAVLSLGKLCEDHGYSYEWSSGQKPRLILKWQTNTMQHGKLRTDQCPWFVDWLFQLSYTYISSIITAGSSNSYIASSVNKK